MGGGKKPRKHKIAKRVRGRVERVPRRMVSIEIAKDTGGWREGKKMRVERVSTRFLSSVADGGSIQIQESERGVREVNRDRKIIRDRIRASDRLEVIDGKG